MRTFFDHIREAIEKKQATHHYKIATNYRSASRSLARFTALEGIETLSLSDIQPTLMECYESYLHVQCGISRNTSSAYMRSLRAIYNACVRQGLCTDAHPFSNVYTGVCSTQKRALPSEILHRLFKLDLRHRPQLSFTRDLFLFSFLAHGIAFIDLAKLRTSNLHNGHLLYTRSKTGKPVRCAVDATMRQIIHRWHCADSTRLFPILGEHYEHRCYESALHRYNRRLHQLSPLCGSVIPLTSYSVRHSWASTAYRLEVPISVISTCLGHSTEAITRIYLQDLDTDYIDSKTSIVNRTFLPC